jgi:hypothetical protein
MLPNYRGLLAIIPPAVLQGSHQPASQRSYGGDRLKQSDWLHVTACSEISV